MLNHLPTVGTVIALAMLILSIIRTDDGGESRAGRILRHRPADAADISERQGTKSEIAGQAGVSGALIDRHHDAALLASVFMVFTGFTAWLGLWQLRRVFRLSRLNLSTLLLLSVVTLTLMARTATIGGEIRHPEILAGTGTTATADAVASGPGWL